jgi:hypothetical protein
MVQKLKQLFGLFSRVKNSDDIPKVTDYLANNQTFKNTAMNIHKAKSNWKKSLEDYLDKELLDKEQAKQIED